MYFSSPFFKVQHHKRYLSAKIGETFPLCHELAKPCHKRIFVFVSFPSHHIDKRHKLRYNQITFCTALHSVWNARSTVQTEQAMTFGHGAGSPKGGSRWHTMHLWDSCMFHRCFFTHFWNDSSQAGANKSNHHCRHCSRNRRIIL